MGRTVAQADGSLRFAYPGVRLSLAFEGRALSVDAVASGERSHIEVTVDGGATRIIGLSARPRTISITATVFVAELRQISGECDFYVRKQNCASSPIASPC
nr:hypothetical protein [Massilia sp. CCM 8734]